MRRCVVIITIGLAVTVAASNAEAKLDLYVDKSTQRIAVVQDGYMRYVWPVSTGTDSHGTPNGIYAPEHLERSWFSKEYYNAPMPYAIFFHNGYAIHGSSDIARLGGPASHGCVRLSPQHAAILFAMVEHEGPGNTTIVIGGDSRPNPQAPGYRDMDDLIRSVSAGDSAVARAIYPLRPRAAPYDGSDHDHDGEAPGRRRSDNGRFASRGVYRPPAPRRDIDDPNEPARGAPAEPEPPVNDRANPSVTRTPPPSPPAPAEQPAPSAGYKILPKSYWSGASWRWRPNAD
jgi:L,D-transpeptidase catalytic domain